MLHKDCRWGTGIGDPTQKGVTSLPLQDEENVKPSVFLLTETRKGIRPTGKASHQNPLLKLSRGNWLTHVYLKMTDKNNISVRVRARVCIDLSLSLDLQKIHHISISGLFDLMILKVCHVSMEFEVDNHDGPLPSYDAFAAKTCFVTFTFDPGDLLFIKPYLTNPSSK